MALFIQIDLRRSATTGAAEVTGSKPKSAGRHIAALILSAGESRRMGSPKALLTFQGETFLDRLIGKLQAANCAPIVVVLGHNATRIRSRVRRPGAQFTLNPDYARGMLTSLQCGLRAVPGDATHVLFTLVDHPNPATGTLAALTHAPDAPVAIPRYRNRKGHPVRISRIVADEILALSPNETAKDALERHLADTLFLDLEDPGVLDDIDDPAAYRDFLARAAAMPTERHV
jgi:molybdenum cofactor cytidylyltransferase